jgi:light-regulated signal transduction histidine kinase (bacteriophytochrome)
MNTPPLNSSTLHNTIVDDDNEIGKYVRQIEQVNKQLNEFVYIVSHDLKAPLRGIKSLATFLEEELGTDVKPEVKELLSLLQSRTDRMQTMIESILRYSRLANNKGEKENIDLNGLLIGIVELLSIPAHIRIKISKNLPVLHAEKIKVHEVFQNLITNAIKYNDKKEGLIEIGYVEHPEEYEFFVMDNGIGIREEFFTKIFGVFQTLQPKDKQDSTGIGLTIVQKIVEQYGGKIWLESEPGNGTTFRFTWKKL